MAGKGQHKNEERNKALFNDFASGSYTVKELVAKYKISGARIYAIVNAIKADIIPTDENI